MTTATQRLIDGNTRFVNGAVENLLRDQPRRGELTEGQQPFAAVLSCADSRVVPELAFDIGLGEIFTVRVAGNIANASSIASLEYAAAHLGIELLVVLGHESCGAVTAAVAGDPGSEHLDHLVSHIQPSVAKNPGAEINTIVVDHAKYTADILSEKSVILRKAIESGLEVKSAIYRLATGKVDWL